MWGVKVIAAVDAADTVADAAVDAAEMNWQT